MQGPGLEQGELILHRSWRGALLLVALGVAFCLVVVLMVVVVMVGVVVVGIASHVCKLRRE